MDEISKYKKIPIELAKSIAQNYNKSHVIIITHDKAHGCDHVTTYGKSLDEAMGSATMGNKIKKMLGWPDELCHDVPARCKQREKKDDK